jgi:hypothetical protein
MRKIILLFNIVGLFVFSSCSISDAEKLDKILNAEELLIQQKNYGGVAGYYERTFCLKKTETETLMIVDKGSDYQTFVRMDEKKELLKLFIHKAYESNNPNKEMSNSCLTGIDTEYILRSGFTVLTLRPDASCDSIFNLIIYD